MKTLRRIGILVIVTLAFAFTACDDILEVFYPDFAENPDELNFGIGINVRIELPEEEAAASGVSGKQVEIPLIAGFVEDANSGEPLFPPKMKEPDWWWEDGKNILETRFEFRIKQEGEFRVPIWLEKHGNDYPEWDEPFLFAGWDRPDSEGGVFFDDIFDFREGEGPGWIEGFAMIGFEKINYNFSVKNGLSTENSFVIQASDIGARSYLIETLDPEQEFVERVFRVFDFSRAEEDPPREPLLIGDDVGRATYPSGVGSDTFSIDFDDPIFGGEEENYWVEVELWYPDGGWAFHAFTVRVIYQEFAGALYDLKVNFHNTLDDPLRLIEGEPYTALVQIFRPGTGPGPYREFFDIPVSPDQDGLFSVEIADLDYNPAEATDIEIDYVWIILNVINPDEYGPGDWSIFAPLGVASGETVLEFGYAGWMLKPLFGVVE